MAGILAGKTGIIFGVANKRSIAWGIAQAIHAEGGRLIIQYLNEDLGARVKPLVAEGMPGAPTLPCDVSKEGESERFFEEVAKIAPEGIDFLVHSIAFAPPAALGGQYVDTQLQDWLLAMNISAYSLVLLSRLARPLMKQRKGGSIITLTYLGSERVVPNYNVMGVAKAALEASVRYLASDLGPDNIRVNGVSAGPVNTVSARGISGFTDMLSHHAERAPLRRNIEVSELGQTAVFLLSEASTGITGDILFVDAGYHIMGL